MHLYKIKCLTTDDFYIGSTCNFKKRTNNHRTKFKCNVRNDCDKLYDFMRINGGFDNFAFEILFTFDNITRKELYIKENELITDLKPTLNAKRAYKTKEEKLKYQAEYRKTHPEKVKKYRAKYNKKRALCDCGKTYSLNDKSQHLKTKYHSRHSSGM